MIDEDLPVSGADISIIDAAASNSDKLQIASRLTNLLDTIMSIRDETVTDGYGDLVVYLPAKGYDTTDFDMTDERRECLVQAGRDAMTAYLVNRTIRTR